MAQWAKVLAAKHDDLSSSPRSHGVEGQNWLKLSSEFHIYIVVHASSTYTHTHEYM